MVYHLNQNTQLGNITDEMLQKMMTKKQEETGMNDRTSLHRQIDKAALERSRERGIKLQEEKKNNEEYNNLKARDHRLALNILLEEKKSLEEQIASYKALIKDHEVGKGKLNDVEMTGVYRIYEHLMLQRRQLDKHITRFEDKTDEKQKKDEDKEREQEKENVIMMLAKKYSDTL